TAKLAEWEALTEGATEGEWSWIHDTRVTGEAVCRIGSLPGNHDVGCTPIDSGEADADFITVAHNTAMPALLGFVRDVLAACEKAEANPAEDGSVKVHAAVIQQALTKRI